MTKIELWNAALGMIGHDRQVTSDNPLVDASVEASRCATFWEGARRHVFASRPWQWLAIEEALSADGTAENGVTFTFARPDDMVRLISCQAADGTPLICTVHGSKLFSDAEEIYIKYVGDDTDPTAWPPLIVDAVASELAARIAIPMTGNFDLSNSLRSLALDYVEQAEEQYGDRPEGEQPQQQARPQRRRSQ